MKKITSIFYLSLFLFNYYSSASASTILSLQEAYKLALEKTETISIQESKLSQLNEKINQARGAIYPKFNFHAGFNKQDVADNSTTKSDQTYLKLNATQPIFHGLKEFYNLNINKLDYKSQQEQTGQTKINLYLQVSQLYYSILSTKSDLQNLNEQLELTSLRIKELKERTKVGRTRKADFLTAESQKAIVASQIDSTNWQMTIYKENFAYITGISDVFNIELVNPPNTISYDYYISKSVNEYLKDIDERFDVKSIKTQIESSKENISNAKSNRYPSIDLNGNYYLQRSATTINSTIKPSKWDVGITLTMPLFDGMVTTAQVAEATSKYSEKRLQYSQLKRQAEQEIKIAYDKIKSGSSQLRAIQEAIKAADKAYKEQLKDYRNGLASNLDVLQSQNTLLDAKKNYDRTRYQILISISELQVASGKIR
ncbi:MAG: TolC family protein [Oligoflexia bacterium]|nr:TolC family protein [Oligoflexia bacterium]